MIRPIGVSVIVPRCNRQRYMATRDVGQARRALATQLCVSSMVAVTLTLVGFALLGYFRANSCYLRREWN